MQRLIVPLLVFFMSAFVTAQSLDDGLSKLAKQISSGMTESNKKKIAVVEFSDLDGKITEFGKYLSEELITRLFLTKKFHVVERQLLNKILEEHKLNLTGIIDESTAKKIGNILGVDAICTGTITDLVDYVKVNARLIDTETGSIFSVASTRIKKDEVVEKLMGMVSVLPKRNDVAGPRGSINVAGNLVVNGDFSRELKYGWTKEVYWDKNNPSEAGINYAEIKNNELHIHHEGLSRIRVYQEIDIISTKLTLFIKAELRTRGYADTRAIIAIYYKDGAKYLGKNDIIVSTERISINSNPKYRNLYWKPTKNESTGMKEFFIDIEEELSKYLIGIPKEKVNRIRIQFECIGKQSWGSNSVADIWVKKVELKYK